jgi:hypothetical protein
LNQLRRDNGELTQQLEDQRGVYEHKLMYSCKFQKRDSCHEVMKALTSSKAHYLRTCRELRRDL